MSIAAPIGGEPSAIEPGLASRSDVLFYLAYNTTNWTTLLGVWSTQGANLTQTPYGFDGTGYNLFLKAGTVGISDNGDASTYFTLKTAGVDDKYHDEMYFRYYIQADPNFPYVQGGKIPGMCAHQSYGSGSNPPEGEGWSARYMWDMAGELYLYGYTQSNAGWGTHIMNDYNGRRAQLIPGKWHCIEQYIKLNDVGSANGKVYTWMDGNLVLKKEDMEIITGVGTDEKLEWNREFGSQFQCFYGGADSGWASPRDTWMRFDNVAFAKNYIGPRSGTDVCSQPTIATVGGTYVNKVLVTVSADDGDTIRYTTNGLEPTYYSQEYTGPVLVSKSCTFKARAFNDNKHYSPVSASADYTITNPATPVANAAVSPSDDSYVRDSGENSYGNDNYGTETTLCVRDGGYGSRRRMMLKFPLSSIERPASAKIRLYFSTVDPDPTPVVIWEMPVGTWTNSSVTWNNRPQEGDVVGERNEVAAVGWQEWDVSNVVAAAIERGDSSIAFTVVALEDTGSTLAANSKENSTNPPELVISSYPADTESPSTPTNLVMDARSATTATLSWTASTDNYEVTSYEIFRDGTSVGTSTGTTFKVTGLTQLTSYSFTVKALDEAGNASSASSALSVTTLANDTEPPSTPSGLAASTIAERSFTLTWNASTDNYGVADYEIFRDGSSVGTSTGTSTDVSGLEPATTYSFTVKAKDDQGNLSTSSDALSVTTLADETAPSWSSQYPKADTATASGFTVRAKINEAGTAYYVVVADGATAPSVAQVKDGQDSSGSAALKSGTISLSANTEGSAAVTGMSENTAYDVYLVAQDAYNNLQSNAGSVNISTLDVSAPTNTSGWPKADTATANGFTVRAKINEAGTAYYVVVADESSAPSVAQIKAGQNASGTAALASGNISLSADTEATKVVNALVGSTAYDVYVVSQDDETTPNVQSSASKLDITTLADTTAPTWTSGWPKVDTATGTGFTVRAKINEAGTAYYVVVADAATAPSVAQVKDGQDSSGSAALKSGTISLSADTEGTAKVSGLSNSTAYDIYIVAADAATSPNTQSSATPKDLSTTAADTAAPSWSTDYPKANSATQTGFTLRFRTNENNSTAYYVVVADGSSAPTSAQIKAGQNASGAAALKSGSYADFASYTEVTSEVTGLTAGTAYDLFIIVEDDETPPNISSIIQRDITTQDPPDTTAPAWTSGWPKADTATDNGFTVRSSINEGGKAYYVVVADGAAAPSATQVKAGKNASDTAALKSGNSSLSANTESAATVTGLSASTAYDVYFVAQDDESTPNVQDSATQVDVTTAPPDTTAPTWTSGWPKVDTATSGGFTARAKLNEAGKAYYVVVADGATAPSTAQVKAGNNASDAAALKSGNITLSVDTEGTATVTGLPASTAYDVYFVAQDAATNPNLQSSVVKAEIFTTLDTTGLIVHESAHYTVAATNPDPDGGTNSGNGYPASGHTSTGVGLKGNWGTDVAVASDGLSYTDGESNVLSASARALSFTGTAFGASTLSIYTGVSPDPFSSYRTVTDKALDASSKEIWMSVLMKTSDTSKSARFVCKDDDGGTRFYVGLHGGKWCLVDKDNAGAIGGVSATANTTALLLVKITYGATGAGATDDTVELWVNPCLTGDLGTADSTYSSMSADLGQLQLRADAAVLTFDELRIGTSKAVVLPVAVPDTTAPAWSSGWPKADTALSDGFTVRAKIDEAGTAYYVVVADGSSTPSAAQVKAGNNASDTAALKSGSIVLSANTENTVGVTGLSPNTSYDVYVVAEDASSTQNLQSTVSALDVTTTTGLIVHEPANYTAAATNPDPDGGANSGNGYPASSHTTTGVGLKGTWGTDITVASDGLSYTDGESNALSTSARALSFTGTSWGASTLSLYTGVSPDPFSSYRTVTNKALDAASKEVWLSVLMRTTDATKSARFVCKDDDGGTRFYIGLHGGKWCLVDKDNAGAIGGVSATANTIALLLVKITYGATVGGATDDKVELWVNPSLTSDLGTADSTYSSMSADLGQLSLRADAAVLTFDELRIGTSKAAVLPVAAPVLTAIETWRDDYFGQTDNTGDAADDADPDGDGIVNLLEYALGSEPDSSASRPDVTSQILDLKLQITFTPQCSDITYIIEASSDLSDWSDQTDVTSLLTVGESYTHTDSVTLSAGTKRFLRLKVSQ
jgi:chitodextrinase